MSFLIRFLDIVFSLLGILLLFPVFPLLYITICFESKGGGFYKQLHVEQYGRDFRAYKFRSTCVGADKKGLITVGERGPRIAHTGYFVRKYRLDELPQLFNVLKGDMSLVGPWPGARKYVDLYTDDQKGILGVHPEITDYASIECADESTIFGKTPDPDKAHIEQIVPDKIWYNMKYIHNRSVKECFKIIFLAFQSIIR